MFSIFAVLDSIRLFPRRTFLLNLKLSRLIPNDLGYLPLLGKGPDLGKMLIPLDESPIAQPLHAW